MAKQDAQIQKTNNCNSYRNNGPLALKGESLCEQWQNAKKYITCMLLKSYKLFSAPILRAYSAIRGIKTIEVLTAALCFIGVVQAWSFISTEKSFLIIDGMNFSSGKPQPNTPLAMIVSIKNGGRITAFIRSFNQTVTICPNRDFPPTPRYVSSPNKSDISGPIIGGGVKTAEAHPFSPGSASEYFILRQDMLDAINSGAMSIFVFGYVEFTDAFSILKDASRTGFCYVYNPNSMVPNSMFNDCPQTAYTYAK